MSKMTVEFLTTALLSNKDKILARQKQIEATLSDNVRNRSSRNRRPHGGWVVPGKAAWTRAIKNAGIPHDDFWSGSLPTPSTQYPLAACEFLDEICKKA